MAGIFIGIGGIGGSIVAEVRRTLELRVRSGGVNPAVQAAADQFRFLLLDTWKDSVSQGFAATECFDLPVGQDKYDVDPRIDDLYYGDDPAFPRWWPEDRYGSPLKVGDFAAGAGQLRIKGKLAYRIRLTGRGGAIVPAVEARLLEINNVLGPAEDVRTIPIYLVCSLGGGTGSGMALVFAQHLRERLAGSSPLIGVFPLASVAEMAPGGGERASIWANTDAALREIDYMQRMAGTAANEVKPFFDWQSAGNLRIQGSQRPFSYIYLFGRENANGLAFERFDQYVHLIAECLIAESFSELVDEARMDKAISGPHSQFIQELHGRSEILGRPTTYASAAVGAVRYPADRVGRHLACRYAARVLARTIEVDDRRGEREAATFLNDQALDWDGTPSFENQFDQPLRQGTADAESVPVFPPLDAPAFQRADRATTLRLVEDHRTHLEAWTGKDYDDFVARRRGEIVNGYLGPQGSLRRFALARLEEGGAHGLGQALAAIAALRRALEQETEAVTVVLHGDGPNGRVPGLLAELRESRDEANWLAATQRLVNGFGLLRREGKDAKAAFVKQTWQPLERLWAATKRAQAGAAAFAGLAAEAKRIELGLSELAEQTRLTADALTRMAETDLGQQGYGGALDVAVMDDWRLVGHHFRSLLDGAEASSGLASAARIVMDEDGVRGALGRKLDAAPGRMTVLHDAFREAVREMAVEDGVALLGEGVQGLTVWDALAAECGIRQELKLIDEPLSTAMIEVRKRQESVQRAGGSGDDWDAVLLQTFIQNKLFECQKRVRPFWKLNNGITASNAKPYAFTVIARDERVYNDARNTLGLGDVLDQTAALMGTGRPYELPGRHVIVLYAREGVAPLAYLDAAELADLRHSAAQVGAHKFLYTDRRFQDVVDPVIKPHEPADDALRYLVSVAFHLGLIRGPAANGNAAGPVLYAGETFDSMPTIYRRVKEDETLRLRLACEFNTVLAEIPGAQHDGEVQDAQRRAQKLYGNAVAADAGDDKRFWQAAVRVIADRLEYGQYRVDV